VTKTQMAVVIIQALYNMPKPPRNIHPKVRKLAKRPVAALQDSYEQAKKILASKVTQGGRAMSYQPFGKLGFKVIDNGDGRLTVRIFSGRTGAGSFGGERVAVVEIGQGPVGIGVTVEDHRLRVDGSTFSAEMFSHGERGGMVVLDDGSDYAKQHHAWVRSEKGLDGKKTALHPGDRADDGSVIPGSVEKCNGLPSKG
jgi:hypothetical protein